MSQKITKKFVLNELYKCGTDPIYFLKNYALIQHPTRGRLKFGLYDFQEDLIKAYVENRFNVILKSRQLGITTTTAGYIAWLALFNRDKNIVIVSTQQKVAKNTIKKIKFIYKNVPKWMRGSIVKMRTDNVHSIELENGSSIQALTNGGDVGRSEAVSFLFVDEAAHIPKFEESWTGIWPTLSAGGSAALASTPKGTSNLFYKIYKQAQEGNSNFNCKLGTYTNPHNPEEVYTDRLMWWVHPDYDQDWFEFQTKDKNPRDIAQEFLCNFLASGQTFILPEDIDVVEKGCIEPIDKIFIDRNCWIYKKPSQNGTYLINADVARGNATDYSAFHVLRLDGDLEQVAEYKGKVSPNVLGEMLEFIGTMYGGAKISIENNGGWASQTIQKLFELKYRNIYFDPKKYGKAHITPEYAQLKGLLPGYSVTSANREKILAKLEEYVRLKYLKINSERTVNEFKTFIIKESGKIEAQRGTNDDLVMALAGAIWVREEGVMYYAGDSSADWAMLEGTNIVSTKTSEYRDMNKQTTAKMMQYSNYKYDHDENKFKAPNGEEIDFSWLISKG